MKRTIKGNVNLGKATFTPLANVKQLDDIILELDIYSNSVPLDITGQTISLYAKRSNKTTVEQLDNITKDTTRVTINVKNSCFAILGITEMELRLVDDTGSISTSTFYITVDESLSSKESINANNEIAILDEAKIEEPIRQANEDIRVSNENTRKTNEIERTEAEELRKQNEIARETSYKEITDARVDFDGSVHDSLNERLTEDMTQVMNRFNNASLLDYSGEYITANESYEGRTEELTVNGRTLQNLFKPDTAIAGNEIVGYWSISNTHSIVDVGGKTITLINPTNKKIRFNIRNLDGSASASYDISPFYKTIVALESFKKISAIAGLIADGWTDSNKTELKCMILEGDWTNKPVPSYFEGIRSVGESGENLEVVSCGKNLIKYNNSLPYTHQGITFEHVDDAYYIKGISTVYPFKNIATIPANTLKGTYVLNQILLEGSNTCTLRVVDRTVTPAKVYTNPFTILDNHNTLSVEIACAPDVVYNDKLQIQLECGTTPTPHETYKEHRQPITLTEPLRGLPDGMRDTVDFERGVVVRNVGKVVLNGSENWYQPSLALTNTVCFVLGIPHKINIKSICDRFIQYNSITGVDLEGFAQNGSQMYFRILKTKLTTLNVTGFIEWLQANPVTVYYQLATPIEEPIANLTQLRTCDKVTNVFTNGSLINPTIITKVPTNVNSVIKTLQAVNARLTMVIQQNSLNTIALSVDQEARLTKLELGVI